MGAQPVTMRAGDITDAPVFLIHLVEGEPHREGLRRVELEVVTVLMRWRWASRERRLVEVLHVAGNNALSHELLGESPWFFVHEFITPGAVVLHLLNLLQGRERFPVFIKDMIPGQLRDKALNEFSDLLLADCNLAGVKKTGEVNEAIVEIRLAKDSCFHCAE